MFPNSGEDGDEVEDLRVHGRVQWATINGQSWCRPDVENMDIVGLLNCDRYDLMTSNGLEAQDPL